MHLSTQSISAATQQLGTEPVAAWLSSINKVALHRAQLVVGWANHLSMPPTTRANSASYQMWNGKWVPVKVRWRSVVGE